MGSGEDRFSLAITVRWDTNNRDGWPLVAWQIGRVVTEAGFMGV